MDATPAPTESLLIERARRGDQVALKALCDRYHDHLRARVERRLSPAVRRRVAASDVIQEALIVAAEQLDTFEDRSEGSFGRWLGRIVDLKAQQMVRHHAGRAKRDVAAEVMRPDDPTLGSIPCPWPSPSQVAMGEEMRRAAQQALQRLPDAYRQVIQFIQGEGLTLAQAGERMERSRDSIKGLYSRALGRLARELDLDGDRS
ncbi:MAG: sigma-70 family RNA polymerase sigma factor [Planctomycetota bacterium]